MFVLEIRNNRTIYGLSVYVCTHCVRRAVVVVFYLFFYYYSNRVGNVFYFTDGASVCARGSTRRRRMYIRVCVCVCVGKTGEEEKVDVRIIKIMFIIILYFAVECAGIY